MANQTDIPEYADSPGQALPLDPAVRVRLSIMMFLEYAIHGAWLPLFFIFLTRHRGLTAEQAGWLFSFGATGALLAPFIAGQIADRWFNTEKFLAISHLVGAVLVWRLANVTSWNQLLIYSVLYSLIYAPTLALTNSLAFHHLPDRDRDFGKVRVWGTVGWIVAGIGVAQWLYYRHTPVGSDEVVQAAQVAGMADSLRASAVLGLVMGVYCLFLPKTPPRREKRNFAAAEALREIARGPLVILFVICFFVACVHQFYFVLTAPFLNSLNIRADLLNRIFGVGGGGLMTIGQISELAVLTVIPFFAKRFSRKAILTVGLLAYIARFAIFAYLPYPWAVIPGLALHGIVFGCFFFIAFMIVDEQTTGDVRASAQGLFNLVIIGFGTIFGNLFAGYVGEAARTPQGTNFTLVFSVPLVLTIACLAALLLFYPRRVPVVEPVGAAAAA